MDETVTIRHGIQRGSIASIDRVDLIDAGIRISLKLRSSVPEEQPGANDSSLTITRVFPMQIRRRGFEMRLLIVGNRAPAPLADLALIKAIARGHLWADDLLTARVESVAALARREGVLPNYVRRLTRLVYRFRESSKPSSPVASLPSSQRRCSLNASNYPFSGASRRTQSAANSSRCKLYQH
jgi:hypothetical protein